MPGLKVRTLAVLGFHKIGKPSPGAWESWYYIPEQTFLHCLQYLREAGWQVISLYQLLYGLRVPQSLPSRSVLLTFDDGYRSVLKSALPLMQRCGYPGVLFVPTNFIGGRFPLHLSPEAPEEVCDWDDLRRLERSGISIESHGTSHVSFSQLSGAELREEVQESKHAIETQMHKRVRAIAFPYGDAGISQGATSRILRETSYQAGFLYGGGPMHLPIRNPYSLSRIAMGSDSDISQVLR
jgi:peptidoglycan/xylan/chitin deacetylase (PgdA/CDA1 family)